MSMAKAEYDRLYEIFEHGEGGLKKADIRGIWDGDGCWLFADGSALTWTEPEGRNLGSDDDYFMAHLCIEPGIEDGPHNPDQCIVCGKPRDGGRIWCGDDACLEVVKTIPTEKLNALREREAIAAWRQHPMPADGRGVYIHVTPKEERN